jgi:hypothetical protein
MTPEVTKRLSEITVDPKTVTMDKKTEMKSGPGASVGGKWTWTVEAPGQMIELAVDLRQEAAAFSGTSTSMIGNALIEGGKVSGKSITAVLKAHIQDQPMEFAIAGTVEGDKITGTITGGGFGSLPFIATRSK